VPDPVDALVAAALQQLPDGVSIDNAAFQRHVSSILGDSPEERLPTLHMFDLAIAFACAARDPVALQHFEATHVPPLRTILQGRGHDASNAEDVLQEVRQRFLLDDPPKMLAYGGRGPLGAWLRVAAVRMVLTSDRKRWREQPLEDALIVASPSDAPDPHRSERTELLREVLRSAVAALSASDRALLRLYYADEIGVEELGRMYRVHASTISRRLSQARAEVLTFTRSMLVKTIATRSGVESMLAHAASLELNLDSLLRSHDGT
jgi:RNA polymerase sigma-70 factor (ECF subfamily)